MPPQSPLVLMSSARAVLKELSKRKPWRDGRNDVVPVCCPQMGEVMAETNNIVQNADRIASAPEDCGH